MRRFDVGARVIDPSYGHGVVIAVEDEYIRIQFDEHGIKKFLTSLSRLEPSNAPVPFGSGSGKGRRKRKTTKPAAETGKPPAS